jgi:hypothetical protein
MWQRRALNFRFKFQTAKRPRSRAAARVGLLSFSPLFEGRRNAKRRTLVTAAACFPDRRETEAHGNASRRPAAASFRPWSALPGTWLPAISRRSPVPVQPASVADPCSGAGRKPRASRVCACEAQPQAPRPTGLGYPAPAKLSLCPTSVTPLEAPLVNRTRSG